MEINIKDTTKEPKEKYELGKLYKDDDGDVFYFVQNGEYFNVKYLTIAGHLANFAGVVNSSFRSIQEIVERTCSSDIPETPIPAKKLTIEF